MHYSLGVPYILRVILDLVTLAVYLAFGLEWTQTNDLEYRHTLLYLYDHGSTSTCVYKYHHHIRLHYAIYLHVYYLSINTGILYFCT